MAIQMVQLASAAANQCQVSIQYDDTTMLIQSIRCQNQTQQPMKVTANRIEGGSASHTFAANVDETFDVRLFALTWQAQAPSPDPGHPNPPPTKGILVSISWPAAALR